MDFDDDSSTRCGGPGVIPQQDGSAKNIACPHVKLDRAGDVANEAVDEEDDFRSAENDQGEWNRARKKLPMGVPHGVLETSNIAEPVAPSSSAESIPSTDGGFSIRAAALVRMDLPLRQVAEQKAGQAQVALADGALGHRTGAAAAVVGNISPDVPSERATPARLMDLDDDLAASKPSKCSTGKEKEETGVGGATKAVPPRGAPPAVDAAKETKEKSSRLHKNKNKKLVNIYAQPPKHEVRRAACAAVKTWLIRQRAAARDSWPSRRER